MDSKITYQEMVKRYGEDLAFDLLCTVERAARTESPAIYVDEEERLQRAFAALDKESLAA